MAVTPLHNIIFVNQNMNVAASNQTSQFNRFDIQQAAAQALANEKEKRIEETRPAEESYKIDPEKEHQRQEAREEAGEESSQPPPHPKKRHDDPGLTVDEDGTPHIDIHV